MYLCRGTHSVDQAVFGLTEIRLPLPQVLGLKVCATIPRTHRDLSTSASQALGLKLCTATPNSSLSIFFLFLGRQPLACTYF